MSFHRIPRSNVAKSAPKVSNDQLLSTGIPSLDTILGGGISSGNVLLIEEDKSGIYADVIFRNFVSEGLCMLDVMCVANMRSAPILIKELSRSVEKRAERNKIDSKEGSPLQSSIPVNSCAYFAAENLEDDVTHNENRGTVVVANFNERRCYYRQLISTVMKALKIKGQSTCLRICILSLGSLFWNQTARSSVCKFLYHLRALMRFENAVCLLTVPVHLFKETKFSRRMGKLCDNVIRIQSFSDSLLKSNEVYSEYQGQCQVLKVSAIKELSNCQRSPCDYGIKLRKQSLSIEVLHIPPSHDNPTANCFEIDSSAHFLKSKQKSLAL